MENKEDWDKLKAWQQKKDYQTKEEWKAKSRPHKGIVEDSSTKFVNFARAVKDFFVLHLDLVYLFIAIIAACVVLGLWKTQSSSDIDAEKYFEGKYQQSIVILSETEAVDGKERKHYYTLAIEQQPDLKFYATREGRNWEDDFENQKFRYYFENWKSEFKEHFVTEKVEEDSLLKQYVVIYPINQWEEIEEGITALVAWKNEMGKQNDWKIGLKKDETMFFSINQLEEFSRRRSDRRSKTYLCQLFART